MPKASSRLETLQIRKLLDSLRRKNVEQIKKLLYHGLPHLIDLGEPKYGITPLIQCILLSDLQNMKAMLKLGANVNECDNKGATPIMHAAKLGNLKAFQILQDFNPNTNVVDKKCRNVLFYCISSSDAHSECLKLALESKVDVDVQDVDGYTALNEACKQSVQNENICKILLMNRANPNIPSNNSRTPLMEACASGSGKVVAMLARMNADLEFKNSRGQTAIFEAAQAGHLEPLVSLSAFGAKFDICDKKENTAMHFAARGNPLSCRFLGQRGCNGKLKNSDGELPRNIATDEGFRECIKEIKKAEKLVGKMVKNAEPWAIKLYDFIVVFNNELTERLKTKATDLAILKEQRILEAELAAKALEMGQDDATNTIMGSVVSVASSAGSEKSKDVKKKKKKKSSRSSSARSKKSQVEDEGPEPLDRIPSEDVFEILCSLEAPLDDEARSILRILHDKDKNDTMDWKEFLTCKKFINKNYLMSAYEPKKKKKKKGKAKAKNAGKNPLDICELPKEHYLRRLDGGPPIMYIPKFENFTDPERFDSENVPANPLQDDSKWYIEPNPRRYIHINEAAKYGDLASIQLALAEGYSVDTRDKWYKTPLMTATQYGNVEMVNYLIKLGADVNAQDNFKWTALHHAAHAGMIEIVELLIRHGANIDAKALNGATPLGRAVETSKYNVVNYMVGSGAKILAENHKGNTIVENSFYWSDPRVIELLQAKYETLPAALKEKKDGGGGKNSQKGKEKPKSPTKKAENSNDTVNKTSVKTTAPPGIPPLNRRISGNKYQNLFAGLPKVFINNSMMESVKEKDNALYYLSHEWKAKESIRDRIQRRIVERMRYGWDAHLPDVAHTYFEKNTKRITEEAQTENS